MNRLSIKKRPGKMKEFAGLGKKPRKAPYKKPNSVLILESMAMNESRRKHPTCPHIAPRTFRDDTANSLTRCINEYLRLSGAFSSRVNNGGVFDPKTRQFKPGTSRRGLPDIISTYLGKSLFIEVKVGRDRMSEYQKQVKEDQEASGGIWFTAHDFTSFKTWFDNLKSENHE